MEGELQAEEDSKEIVRSVSHSSFSHSITMTEEGIDTLVIPEIIGLEVGNNNGVKIISRYRRASIGSCHDLCKYGSKYDFEGKSKSPMLKGITTPPCEDQYLEKTKTLAKIKKTYVIWYKPPPDSKTQIPDMPLVIKREFSSSAMKAGFSRKDISSPGKEIDVSTRRSSDSMLKPTRLSSLPTPRLSSIKRNSDSRKNPLGGSSIRRIRKTEISNETGTHKISGKEVLVPSSVSLSPRRSVKKVASINAGKYKNLRGISHLKNRNNARKAEPEQGSDEKVVEKILYVIEPAAGNITVAPAQNGTHTTQFSPSSKDKNLRCTHNRIQTTQSPPSSENKNLSRTRNGISTIRYPPSSENKNLSRTRKGIRTTRSPPSFENKNPSLTRNGIHTTRSPPSTEKKSLRHTRYGIRSTQSSSSPLLSLSSSKSDSTLSGENGTTSKHDETETVKQLPNRRVEYRSRPRRGRIPSPEDKDPHPYKLKFRRGKVVDVQSADNSPSPRRLRFRQGRAQGENQNGKDDAKWRSYRRREFVDGELNGNNTESEKVVLKHQGVERRKDAQSLFNNVIKETASKLAQTRKSKVKALVGAFETVISLQETKASAVTSTY